MLRTVALIGTFASIAMASQQDRGDLMLADRFGSAITRPAAVAEVVAAGPDKVPILLAWTRNPPSGVDRHQLYIGMADAFGELRTKDAIPFLIKNIDLHREDWPGPVWLKSAEATKERLPCVAALIKIGPEASDALIRTSDKLLRVPGEPPTDYGVRSYLQRGETIG
jgi:hypothetical protein